MSELGFGLMRLPLRDSADSTSIDKEATRAMVDRFLAAGFHYFDTAYVYHGGESEKVFGELVADRYPRESFVVTTKMPVFNCKDKSSYGSFFNEQLRRCHVDYFDYYFLHALDAKRFEQVKEQEGFEFLREKKAKGQIRHMGFSFHDDAATLERILEANPDTELVQLQLNYLDWEDEKVQARACYEVCRRRGIPVSVMEPLKGGSLARLPEAAAKLLHEAAPEQSQAAWALRYAGSLDGIRVVLSGMSNMEQMEDNIATMSPFRPLSAEEQALVGRTVQAIHESIAVPCTACRYCVDGCPQKIAIPEYFDLYNKQSLFGMTPGLKNAFRERSSGHGLPSECIGCRLCEDHCPQHLSIPELLQDVAAVFEG